jgi:hypothetical protein
MPRNKRPRSTDGSYPLDLKDWFWVAVIWACLFYIAYKVF